MPLFTFFCTACGAEKELLVRDTEQPACPVCGSEKLEKQMSLFAPRGSASTDPACGGSCCASDDCPMGGDGCCPL